MICFVWSLCDLPSICASVLKKIMNNFWMDGQNWMKFSGVIRLLLKNIWVGSTHLLSPYEVAPGLHPGLFPEIYLLCGFWCYLVMSYYFGKHLMRQTKSWEWIFDLGPRSVAGVKGRPGGGNLFWELGLWELEAGVCGGIVGGRVHFVWSAFLQSKMHVYSFSTGDLKMCLYYT